MNQMMIFALEGNNGLADRLAVLLAAQRGELEQRRFPDGETYLRVKSKVENKNTLIICTLNDPDPKVMPLIFLAQTLKEMGASRVTLIAPYLSYMRQDKIFKPGEALTSAFFARLLSGYVDHIVTIDPHLHRRSNMQEIYSVPSTVLHAAPLISAFIRSEIQKPLLIGPDSESEQWVSEVAREAGAAFVILEKIRRGDREVEVSVPMVEKYKDHTPVLVDDIISTARTMIETLNRIKGEGLGLPVCIGIHGVFAGTAYEDLLNAGASRVITCNTVIHHSNEIDVSKMISGALSKPAL